MDAINDTHRWNSKQHKVENEVFHEMKLQKAVTYKHSRLPVDSLHRAVSLFELTFVNFFQLWGRQILGFILQKFEI